MTSSPSAEDDGLKKLARQRKVAVTRIQKSAAQLRCLMEDNSSLWASYPDELTPEDLQGHAKIIGLLADALKLIRSRCVQLQFMAFADPITPSAVVLADLVDSLIKKLDKGPRQLIIDEHITDTHDLLVDVISELNEWKDDSLEDLEDEIESAGDQQNVLDGDLSLASDHDVQSMVDEMVNTRTKIPKNNAAQIVERVDTCTKRLRLLALFCKAIIKRRMTILPKFPANSEVIRRLQCVIEVMKALQPEADELVHSFYELEMNKVDDFMDSMIKQALLLSKTIYHDWDDKPDEFTDWLAKFQGGLQGLA
ncbi:hypothetical protein CFO_g5172 [Ceratocystis platani]|uniref:Uncharacterized protein n=1 Tax=Ceratocystis fimbriata f. sp. platani TaxID=88771 RepID=A0A0F8BJM6_CERFI|nr:hypothetical protein CFO_g5172 [Ceratocystis platani]